MYLQYSFFSLDLGFGVFSTTTHSAGNFLLQYAGEKIPASEAEIRMKKGSENKMFFYSNKGKDYW